MVKILTIDSGSFISKMMFQDINMVPNAIVTSSTYNIQNPLFRFLNKVHMSGKISDIIHLPFKEIWNSRCILEQVRNDKIDEWIVILTNVSAKKIPCSYLMKFNKMNNVHLILVCVDSFSDKSLNPEEIMKCVNFDLIYSFDIDDCKTYDLIFTQALYSQIKVDNDVISMEKDLFFVGRAKDRLVLLQDLARLATKYDIKCDFYILGVKKMDRIEIPGITYLDGVMPYNEVFSKMLRAKGIIDFVRLGQSGLTVRFFEAVFYNKLLLSNNPNVRNNKYFDDRWMYCGTDYEDFFQRVKETDIHDIDYGYQMDYSPINLLRDIEARLGLATCGVSMK